MHSFFICIKSSHTLCLEARCNASMSEAENRVAKRKSHTKSRRGCFQCKQRHTKVGPPQSIQPIRARSRSSQILPCVEACLNNSYLGLRSYIMHTDWLLSATRLAHDVAIALDWTYIATGRSSRTSTRRPPHSQLLAIMYRPGLWSSISCQVLTALSQAMLTSPYRTFVCCTTG